MSELFHKGRFEIPGIWDKSLDKSQLLATLLTKSHDRVNYLDRV